MRIDRLVLATRTNLVEKSLGERQSKEDLVLALKQGRIRAYESFPRVSRIQIMSALIARTGRDRQRYEDNFRLVAGCIPYRLKEHVDDCPEDFENRLEVLMISTPNRQDLVFPKGGWEDDETVFDAACREALEEAGVRGELNLTVREAFNLCRYEWMRRALEAFLRSEDFKKRTREGALEVTEHPISTQSCFVLDAQLLDESYKCVVPTNVLC